MNIRLATIAVSLAAIPLVASEPVTYVPLLVGEKKMLSEVTQSDRKRDCSVFLRPGTFQADRIWPEGMIIMRDGICIITGTLFAKGDKQIILNTYFDSERKHARQRTIPGEDIDYIVFKNK